MPPLVIPQQGIIINSGAIQFQFRNFDALTQPREEFQISTSDFSLNGAPLDRTPVFRRQVWNFTAVVTPEEFDLLRDVWSLQEGSSIQSFLVDDYTYPMKEISRSRAIAPDAAETTANGLTSYFGRFNARLTAEPLQTRYPSGSNFMLQTSIQMLERDLSELN